MMFFGFLRTLAVPMPDLVAYPTHHCLLHFFDAHVVLDGLGGIAIVFDRVGLLFFLLSSVQLPGSNSMAFLAFRL